MGLCRVDLRAGGDVINGGNAGWLGFTAGEAIGDDDSDRDMTAVMVFVIGNDRLPILRWLSWPRAA